jgi:hypothetical protein
MWSWYQFIKDFFPSIATLLVAFLSIRFAVRKIQQQHQNSLDLQSANQKKDIQLKLFEEIQERLDKCSSLSGKLNTALIMKHTFLQHGANIDHNEGVFINELGEILKAITDVTIYIEYREIVSPKLFRVARSALHSAHHDLLEVIRHPQEDLTNRYEKAAKAVGDAGSYCHDLNACLQNHAFGDLFENQAPIRQPIDPEEKVIIDDDETLDGLLQYFEHETSYGRMMDETNQHVREEFGQTK